MKDGTTGVKAQAASPTRAIFRLTALGLGVALSLFVLGIELLIDARRDAWNEAEQSSRNLVRALERDITRNLAIYDLSLQGAIDALHTPGIDAVSPEIRQAAIFDRAASAEYLGSLLVLDATGTITADSTALPPHVLNLGDRDYFTYQRDHPGAGLFVSLPFRSRLRNGDPSMSISRRIDAPDGSFAGIVLGTLRLAYFRDMFSGLDLGRNGTMSLVHVRGPLVTRTGHGEPVAFGLDIAQMPIMERFLQGTEGAFVTVSPIDGVRRLITYRRVGPLPLVLVMGQAISDIDQAWLQKAISMGGILVTLSVATILLSLLFRREALRRLAAEASAQESADQLAVMAATDALTGLANRRALESGLQREWRRAQRRHLPVALIMIDSDHFKAFNDHLGHPAGDRALQRIAECLRQSIHRPGDIVARYGGEEFVVLLPETGLAGAATIAERLRQAVFDLAIPHPGNPAGRVTISLGVSAARHGAGEDEGHLLDEADRALYEAKRRGRNRVVVRPENGLNTPVPLPDTVAS